MMWNYLVSGPAVGATIVLFDGNPGLARPAALWRLADEARHDLPRHHRAVPAGLPQGRPDARRATSTWPAARPRLDRRAAAGRGLPLGLRGGRGRDPARLALRRHRRVHRVRRPVAAGAGLGRRDLLPHARRAGRGVRRGRAGRSSATRASSSSPRRCRRCRSVSGATPTARGYREAYFDVVPGRVAARRLDHHHGARSCVITGRSDATLNRGGVRLGTAEFYSVVEALPEVPTPSWSTWRTRAAGRASCCCSWCWPTGSTSTTRCAPGSRRAARRTVAAARPRRDPPGAGVPRTLSGKKLEVPVKRILLGLPAEQVASKDALADPRPLEPFEALRRDGR